MAVVLIQLAMLAFRPESGRELWVFVLFSIAVGSYMVRVYRLFALGFEQPVSPSKLTSWFLLMIISVVLVARVYPPQVPAALLQRGQAARAPV